jgi:two-component system, NarL family, response regulator YdfI
VSARLRGDLIAGVSVVAYCRDAAGLNTLADVVRRSAHTELEEATGSLERLAEIAVRASRVVIVARLQEVDEELPEVILHCEGLPLVVLIPNAQEAALQALRAGARAVLGVGANEDAVAAAAMSVFHGLLAVPDGAARFVDPPSTLAAPPEPLTPREMEILSLLAGGDSNKTIAARLSISVHTVKFHISSILSKLNVTSRTEAVALGLRLGIVLL